MDKHYKIEALAEAIMAYSGYAPGSHLWKARNPGGLKAFSLKHESDEHGNRVFASLLDGLQALVFDLNLKLSGKSKVRLKATSTLADLAASYGKPATTGDAWAKFLRKALDADFNRKTPLSYFTE
jgi:hypothetical protein